MNAHDESLQPLPAPESPLQWADHFAIRLLGRGGHAASPELCVDPIVAAAAIVTGAQGWAQREGVAVRVARVSAGSAFNVIPEEARIEGELSGATDDRRPLMRHRFERVIADLATAYEVQASVEFRPRPRDEPAYRSTDAATPRNDPG